MSENLTRSWDTRDVANGGVNPLQEPEAKTLYNMLGDMGNAYPAQHPPVGAAAALDAYPVMNRHLHNRRNSIFNAYNPAEAAAEAAASAAGTPIPARPAGWSRGGRVAGKNLLARFKKPKPKR